MAHSAGLFNEMQRFSVSGRGNSNYFEPVTGDIRVLFGHRKNRHRAFTAIRDLIYNSGTPLQYSDLTDAQKTAIGLVEWFEVGEYQGEEKLTGKHASTVMTGSCIPSRTTQGGAGKLPPINTSIDFTGTTLSGGTAAPWTASQYLGYLTCSGSANGRTVRTAIVGKCHLVQCRVCKCREFVILLPALNRTFIDADNGAGASQSSSCLKVLTKTFVFQWLVS